MLVQRALPRPASCCSGVHLDHRYRAGGGGGRGVRDRGDQADQRRGAAAAGQRGGDRAGPGRQISVLAPVGSARSTRWSRRRTGCWPLRPQPVGPDLATEVMASQVTGAIGASPTDATFAGSGDGGVVDRRDGGPALLGEVVATAGLLLVLTLARTGRADQAARPVGRMNRRGILGHLHQRAQPGRGAGRGRDRPGHLHRVPRPLTAGKVQAADIRITMNCSDACPAY